MIQDFETIKSQLSELAPIINSFQCEAVQLRIVELMLGGAAQGDEDAAESDTKAIRKATPRRRKPKAEIEGEPTSPRKRRASGGSGAVAALIGLVGGDFFDQPRTIGDIIEHCRHNLARTFKANEFSGKLGRLVRNGELVRVKNADNQYEYKKP